MRVRLGASLVVLLLVAACGGGDRDDGESAAGASSSTSVSSGVPGQPTTTVPVGATAPGGGPTATAAPGQVPGDAPVDSGDKPLLPGGVGQLAPALLQPGYGDRIVLEVRAQAGAGPAATTVDHEADVLGQASGKQVTVDGVDALGGAGAAWTPASIVALADGAAQASQGNGQVVVRLLFLRGTYDGDTSVLGVAVRGDVAAIFSDQVSAAAGLLVSPRVVEDAVTVHEVGHLLGLVDLVLDTGRADPQHPGHSTNEDSVMFWAVESDVIAQLLDGGIPNSFDAQDRADLARIRAG